MAQKTLPHFLVIDDDPINNKICSKILETTIAGARVQTFTDPAKGLAHIRTSYSVADAAKAILFLDINMPTMTGWEVLDAFSDFPEPVREKVEIHMLSSSVDPHDKKKVEDNKLVTSYITKSLSRVKLQDLFGDYIG